jgi:single-stranded DNA-binding protein
MQMLGSRGGESLDRPAQASQQSGFRDSKPQQQAAQPQAAPVADDGFAEDDIPF